MTAKKDHDNFVGGIREAVREALAEKEEADRLSKVEELLQTAETTINELTDALASKEEEAASTGGEHEALLAKVAELETKTTELEEKLAEADKVSEERESRATAAEKVLAGIENARVIEVRMAELTEAKVSASSEDALAAQAGRVGELSEEEFSSYKQERIELRSQLEAAFKVQAEAAASEKVKEGEEVVAPDLETVRKEEAAAAAATLDVETPSQELSAKYAEFGAALARNIAGSSCE